MDGRSRNIDYMINKYSYIIDRAWKRQFKTEALKSFIYKTE